MFDESKLIRTLRHLDIAEIVFTLKLSFLFEIVVWSSFLPFPLLNKFNVWLVIRIMLIYAPDDESLKSMEN